jgi:CHC2 zinc finger
MRRLSYDEKYIAKTALCPFHDDHKPSFSVFKGKDGYWHYKCFVCDTQGGDEIAFLLKRFGFSRREAIKRYLEMAGFPARPCRKSREYPEPPASPDSLRVCVSEFPCVSVSEGQDALQQEVKALAAQNACIIGDNPEDDLWQLARDLKGVEKRTGRRLSHNERLLAFGEWYSQSQPFLDPAKSREDYFTMLLSYLAKVRVPRGEGVIGEALQVVRQLSDSDLPVIREYPNAPRIMRLLAALHKELSRRSTRKDKTYFLAYRDAAKICDGLSHQKAHQLTYALVELGVIEIVRRGKAVPNSREAAEFRYLLSQRENHADEDDGELEI